VAAGLGFALGSGQGIASATPSESGDAGNGPAASSPDYAGHGEALKKSVVRQPFLMAQPPTGDGTFHGHRRA
jgi:hypothetical protein